MLKFYSELRGWEVASLRSQAKLAKVQDFLFDPRNGRIPAVIVLPKGVIGLPRGSALLPAEAILGWQEGMVFIQDEEAITPPEDLVRLKDLVDGHFSLIGVRVLTESGKKIGTVEDYSVETKLLSINKLVVRRQLWWFFSFQEVIPLKRVVSMEPKRVVIKDDEGWAKQARVRSRPAQA